MGITIKIDSEKCTGCGTCVDTCPVSVYEVQEKSGKKAVVVNLDQCLACRVCETQCPNTAIQVIEE